MGGFPPAHPRLGSDRFDRSIYSLGSTLGRTLALKNFLLLHAFTTAGTTGLRRRKMTQLSSCSAVSFSARSHTEKKLLPRELRARKDCSGRFTLYVNYQYRRD